MTFPISENVVRGYLRNVFTTTEVARVVTELPASVDTSSVTIVVSTISGTDPDSLYEVDAPILDVDVFAGDRTTANTIAERVRDAIRNGLRGNAIGTAVIAYTRTVANPRIVPDPNPNLRRNNSTYEIAYHVQ